MANKQSFTPEESGGGSEPSLARSIVILSSRVGLGEKPLREGCSPVVRHRVARAGQGDDDLVVQHFDMES